MVAIDPLDFVELGFEKSPFSLYQVFYAPSYKEKGKFFISTILL